MANANPHYIFFDLRSWDFPGPDSLESPSFAPPPLFRVLCPICLSGLWKITALFFLKGELMKQSDPVHLSVNHPHSYPWRFNSPSSHLMAKDTYQTLENEFIGSWELESVIWDLLSETDGNDIQILEMHTGCLFGDFTFLYILLHRSFRSWATFVTSITSFYLFGLFPLQHGNFTLRIINFLPVVLALQAKYLLYIFPVLPF